MVAWTIFKDHLLEVSSTQDRKTMTFQTLITVDLFQFIIVKTSHESTFTELAYC